MGNERDDPQYSLLPQLKPTGAEFQQDLVLPARPVEAEVPLAEGAGDAELEVEVVEASIAVHRLEHLELPLRREGISPLDQAVVALAVHGKGTEAADPQLG